MTVTAIRPASTNLDDAARRLAQQVHEALGIDTAVPLEDDDTGASLIYHLNFDGHVIDVYFDEEGRVTELSAPTGISDYADMIFGGAAESYGKLGYLDATSVDELDGRFYVDFRYEGEATAWITLQLIVDLLSTLLPRTATGALAYRCYSTAIKQRHRSTVEGFSYNQSFRGYIAEPRVIVPAIVPVPMPRAA